MTPPQDGFENQDDPTQVLPVEKTNQRRHQGNAA